MKLKATYNILVLLLIYSFSCVCVLGIEAIFDTSLNMAVVFNNLWTATLETVFMSFVVTACIWFNRSSDNEIVPSGLATSTLVFNTIWFVGLALVVMGNLSGVSHVFTNNVNQTAFLLGIVVNIFAIALYCASFFTIEKFGTTLSYKIIVSIIATAFSVFSLTFSASFMPIKAMQAIYEDGKLHDLLKSLEREIKSTDSFNVDLSSLSWSSTSDKTKSEIKNAISSGRITVTLVDNCHVRMEWKRHIEPSTLDKMPAKKALLKTYSSWHDWGTFYKQTEKVIELRTKDKSSE